MIVSDENYVYFMKQKNEAALEYFIKKDGWIVKSIICRSVAILPEERMECMNDVFFTVWQNIEKYEESRAGFTTWVAGVTKFCILNYLKKNNRMEYLTLDEIWEQEDEHPIMPSIFVQEEKRQFQELLKYLLPVDQEIFLKLFWEEKSYEEISKEMHMEKAVIYNRVSRGKRRLRSVFRTAD